MGGSGTKVGKMALCWDDRQLDPVDWLWKSGWGMLVSVTVRYLCNDCRVSAERLVGQLPCVSVWSCEHETGHLWKNKKRKKNPAFSQKNLSLKRSSEVLDQLLETVPDSNQERVREFQPHTWTNARALVSHESSSVATTEGAKYY